MQGRERLSPLCPPSRVPKASPPAPAPIPRSALPQGPTTLPTPPRRSAVPPTPTPPALRGLPSPFPLADTARGWAPTGSGGSIPAASGLSGAADCGRIRRRCLPRPHPQPSAARCLRNGSTQGTGSREPAAEPSREPDPRESGASRPGEFSRPPQISPPAANLRNCS